MTHTPRRTLPLVLAAAAGSLVLSSCSAFSSEDQAGTSVVAAFYPLQYAAERVAGQDAEVEDLTTPGTEPHDLELGVAATAALGRADVVVYERGFQPAVDAGVEATVPEGAAVVDAAEAVDLRGDDPHFWQDPLLVADLGDAVADALAEADPEHADDYAARAAALRDDLRLLDRQYAEGLTGCARDTIVVSHDAFGYLDRYGLQVAPVAGLSPDAEPTPAGLARLQDLIASDGITTVFSERLASPRLTQSLADDAGVSTAVLDPLEGLSPETADEDYLSLMRENLDALRTANDCP